MTGFLKRFFKGQKPSSEPSVSGGKRAARTKRVEKKASSQPHVKQIASSQMSIADKLQRADGDTGPWYIGKTVADIFEIRSVLGRGGMGIVYLAHDNATQKKVAIKVPLGKFVDDEGARKRFAREAEAWTSLIHPHIVHAFDVKDDQTTDYRPAIFMDYCDGGSLKERIYNSQKLSMPDALDIAIQVCWAMEFAHKKGHIHRDLKPGNVLLNSEGKAFVTDFGLVKILEVEDLGLSRNRLTKTDAQLLASISEAGGTPEYMPPEQWEGKAEKASDIYAFGVMLYELFCGCWPFTAESRLDLRIPHMQVPPPDPKQLNGDIPDMLAVMMRSCLTKRNGERPKNFAKAAEVLTVAYRMVTGRTYSTRREEPRGIEVSRENKKAQAGALMRLGMGCNFRGNLTDTDRHLEKALALFEELGDLGGIGACYYNMALVANNCGHYKDAFDLFQKALTISEELGDKTVMSKCYNGMGLATKAHGDYDRAVELYEKSQAISQELGDKAGLSMCYINMGTVANCQGDYDRAMELYEKSLVICRELDDKVGMGKCYGNMGLVADNRRDYERAMELYEKDLAICKELGNKAGVAACYSNMANVLYARGDHECAMELHEKSLAIRKTLSDKAGIGVCYMNIGNVLDDQGDCDRAMELYEKALAISKDLGNRALSGRCYINMGIVLHKRGECDHALELYEKSLAIKREVGDKPGMARCHIKIGAIHGGRVETFDKSVSCYRRAVELDPDNFAHWFNLGVQLETMRRWREAQVALEEALAIDPNHSLTAEKLAKVRTWVGMTSAGESSGSAET